MDLEKNKATAYRWFTEGWSGNLALADATFVPEFINNGEQVGPAGPKRDIRNRLKGFPDFHSWVEEQFAVDDKVVTRIRWSSTHSGEYSGISATGKPVKVRDISIFRFVGDKVVENWSILDQFSLLQQIGFLPSSVLGFQIAEPEHSF